LPACAELGVGQVVFSPLEQGLLTGKYKPGQPLPEGSRAGDERQNQFIIDLATDQRTLEHVDRLREVAEDAGCSLGQLALAWILRRPEITSCIVGATRPGQIEENAAASGIELSAGQLARLDEIIMPVTFSYDYK
jgi:aryl-alcohol dehydrogenase-like predicted oxidoreductase